MELIHECVRISIDGQHGITAEDLALGRFPGCPEPGNAHGLAIRAANSGGNGFAGSPVRLIDGVSRNDALSAKTPCIAEAGLFGNGLGTGVIGIACYLGVIGPMGDQTERACQRFSPRLGITSAGVFRLVAAYEQAQVSRPQVGLRRFRNGVDAEVLFELLGVLAGFVMGAHGGILASLALNDNYRYDNYMNKSRTHHNPNRPGRTPGTGPYGENTKVMRIPESVVAHVSEILESCKERTLLAKTRDRVLLPADNPDPASIPLYSHRIPAGFPSPADDYIDQRISLDQHLIPHRESTFFVRAVGNSMIDAGIFDGDLLVVDKSIEPVHGHIVIAVIDGELTVKRLVQQNGETILRPANARFKDIVLKDGQELIVWGVVTSTIKTLL